MFFCCAQSGCSHRYERDEPFTTIPITISNCTTLGEALHNYVQGELLEGANAYKCEKCDEKRDTVKRTCIKALPRVLVLQLKRFDYDWERGVPVKFNKYFEFPEDLDMVSARANAFERARARVSVSVCECVFMPVSE